MIANAYEVRATYPNPNAQGWVVRTYLVRTVAEREALYEELIRRHGVDVTFTSHHPAS